MADIMQDFGTLPKIFLDGSMNFVSKSLWRKKTKDMSGRWDIMLNQVNNVLFKAEHVLLKSKDKIFRPIHL